jgi:hypothetical protein
LQQILVARTPVEGLEAYLKSCISVESWLNLEVHIHVAQSRCGSSELPVQSSRGKRSKLLNKDVQLPYRQHVQQVRVCARKSGHCALWARVSRVCMHGRHIEALEPGRIEEYGNTTIV